MTQHIRHPRPKGADSPPAHMFSPPDCSPRASQADSRTDCVRGSATSWEGPGEVAKKKMTKRQGKPSAWMPRAVQRLGARAKGCLHLTGTGQKDAVVGRGLIGGDEQDSPSGPSSQ